MTSFLMKIGFGCEKRIFGNFEREGWNCEVKHLYMVIYNVCVLKRTFESLENKTKGKPYLFLMFRYEYIKFEHRENELEWEGRNKKWRIFSVKMKWVLVREYVFVYETCRGKCILFKNESIKSMKKIILLSGESMSWNKTKL